MFNPSPTMMRFRRYSIELYRELGVFETVGSLRLASSREQFMEQQRGVSRAHGIGLDVELVSAEEARRLMPAASSESLYGAVWVPGRRPPRPALGHARAWRRRRASSGAAYGPASRVTGHRARAAARGRCGADRSGPDRDRGRRERRRHLVAAGGRDGRRVVPSTPVDHQHIALKAVPGSRAAARHAVLPRPRQPRLRQVGAGRSVLFGGYEPDPVARWVDGVAVGARREARCRRTWRGSSS